MENSNAVGIATKSEYKKDYSKLRPFDLEAAKNGDLLCDSLGDNEYVMFDFITRYSTGEVRLSVRHTVNGFEYHNTQPCNVRMKPLAWVEGLPVYEGDELYWRGQYWYTFVVGNRVLEDGIIVGNTYSFDGEHLYGHGDNSGVRPCDLTWNKPKQKVKRKVWINVFQNGCTYSWDSKERADECNNTARIACVETEIEYEV